MKINYSTIKHYLKNVLFINGTAYAGKSTMVKMLADKYDLIHCGENYQCVPDGLTSPETHPNLCYFQTMSGWAEFVSRTPDEYLSWINGCTQELIEFEITYLISIARDRKVIVDTNLPMHVLREIADYNQVAIMLALPHISVEHFFNRNDDKPFLLVQIMKLDDPEKGLANYRNILEKINSQEAYDEWLNSGFFTLERKDTTQDTKAATLEILAKHFGLTS